MYAGAAALVLSQYSDWPPNWVRSALLDIATRNQVTDQMSSPNRLLYVGRESELGRQTSAGIPHYEWPIFPRYLHSRDDDDDDDDGSDNRDDDDDDDDGSDSRDDDDDKA